MPQAYVVYVAALAAIASLLLVSWKIWADRGLLRARHTFERSERALRENFERNETQKREAFEHSHAAAAETSRELAQSQWTQFEASEREKRELFEASERQLRQRFMAGQDRTLDEAQVRIQAEIESFIKLEKWREQSWQRNLARLEQASKELAGATSGLVSLIDEGPFFDDLRMIQETARVLDVFGDFQTSVGHFAMPQELADLSRELIGLITKILLTLSPCQRVRDSEERKAMLAPLRKDLETKSWQFVDMCGKFERDPSAFLGA